MRRERPGDHATADREGGLGVVGVGHCFEYLARELFGSCTVEHGGATGVVERRIRVHPGDRDDRVGGGDAQTLQRSSFELGEQHVAIGSAADPGGLNQLQFGRLGREGDELPVARQRRLCRRREPGDETTVVVPHRRDETSRRRTRKIEDAVAVGIAIDDEHLRRAVDVTARVLGVGNDGGVGRHERDDRAITRDLDWGVELPVDDLGPGKRIYVWYDAVIGYLSASQEWAQRQGDDERWRHWWYNPDSRHVYFIGKDNIPFHCLFWPAQLMGYDAEIHLPDDVPANQYITFKGGKASASRGVGLTIQEGLDLFQPDGLRYALAASFPEQADTDISVEEIARRINEELVATWGNLVNRVLSMVAKNFGEQPSVAGRTAEDDDVLAVVDGALVTASGQLERVELKAALRTAMDAAQAVNAYLNATEPWKIAKEDLDRAGVVLGTALDAINGVRVAFAPYLPFSSAALDDVLGPPDGWHRQPVPTGTPIAKPTPLFTKVDLETLLGDDA